MSFAPQIKILATHMRGGTSKGVFIRLQDLPEPAQPPGRARDALLMRVMGSPDPYGKQIDGMGAATSSTSKTVVLSRSARSGHDVDYLFRPGRNRQALRGLVRQLRQPVGGGRAFRHHHGLVDPARVPRDGICTVCVWQANIGKTIVAHVPVSGGEVQETGDFELDGVTFPAAEVAVEFMDPAGQGEQGGTMFPTGQLVDDLEVPGIGTFKTTLINAGIPIIFLNAADIGDTGTELQDAINGDKGALERFETIRAWGAVTMGLIKDVAEAAPRQATPKIVFVAPPRDYVTSSGKAVRAAEVDLLVRALSMGQLHHAMMGTAAVAIGAAAAVPGTLVNLAAGGGERRAVRFGHPSVVLGVGAEARYIDGQWVVTKALMRRRARADGRLGG